MSTARLDADQLDTAPVAYLNSLTLVANEALGDISAAIQHDDNHTIRAACLRLESVGLLAGIVGRKLDA